MTDPGAPFRLAVTLLGIQLSTGVGLLDKVTDDVYEDDQIERKEPYGAGRGESLVYQTSLRIEELDKWLVSSGYTHILKYQ